MVNGKEVANLTHKEKIPIRSFHDLEVYQNSYDASVKVMKKIVPKLPKSEKNDLKSQISRSCKAVPRLIAEGYAKKHQEKGFQKYLDDSMAESNEMIVNLSHCKDVYPHLVNLELCDDLIKVYDKTSRQLYNLSIAWTNFKEKNHQVT
jgi:four helix bundle protein